MPSVILSPCNHNVIEEQCVKAFETQPFTIEVGGVANDAFSQINEQLKDVEIKCPLCERHVERINPSPISNKRFPLSYSLFSRINISPLDVELHEKDNPAAKIKNVIHFTRVEIANIMNQGRHSNDEGMTYGRMAELSKDFNMFVSSLGSIIGRILYWLPTSWKASVFIKDLEKAREKGLLGSSWILSDMNKQTIGLFSFREIEKEKFDLDGELKTLKLYNITVLLHSNFQQRGVVTELTKKLFDQLGGMNLDIDGLWIITRPDNVGVNHIANKLHFSFIKEMRVKYERLIPCFASTYVPFNLYVKRIPSL